jgi:hypothetical protein
MTLLIDHDAAAEIMTSRNYRDHVHRNINSAGQAFFINIGKCILKSSEEDADNPGRQIHLPGVSFLSIALTYNISRGEAFRSSCYA